MSAWLIIGGSFSTGDVAPIVGSAEITEEINKVSTAKCTVLRNYIQRSDDSLSLQLTGVIHDDDTGYEFSGYIIQYRTIVAQDGSKLTEFELEGREAELVADTLFNGTVVDDETPADALDLLLESSATGWTGAIEGTGYEASITKRFNGPTLFGNIIELAERLKGYARFDGASRIVTISNEAPVSGLVVSNVHSGPQVGAIRSFPELLNDRKELYNRYILEGRSSGNIVYNLGQSDRTDPVVETLTKNKPTITNIETFLFSDANRPTDQMFRQATVGEIFATGTDRAVVVLGYFTDEGGGGSPELAQRCMVGGIQAKKITRFGIVDASDVHTVVAFFATNVPDGILPIEIQYEIGPDNDSIHNLVVIALQDVDQVVGFSFNSARGTSTTPSVTLAGVADEFRLAVLTSSTNFADPTSGANQTRLASSLSTSQDVVVDQMTSEADPTFSWTFGTSEAWAAAALQCVGTRTFYIEDLDSQSIYGLRTKREYIPADSLVGASDAQILAAANTLHDYASYLLEEHAFPKRFWNCDVPTLPGLPSDWQVGNSITVKYQDPENAVDAELVVPSRTIIIPADGVIRYNLDFSNRNQFRNSFDSTIKRFLDALNAQ